MSHPPWDESYTGEWPAPWDIGRPQPEFVSLAQRGVLSGQVLDAGCGTGEHVLLAASHGADARGVDISPRAIEIACGKAAERGIGARFDVGDALRLPELEIEADTVIDSGLFHVFTDEERPRYVTGLASALRPGGHCYLMCFSDLQPGDYGPRRVSQQELRESFATGWQVESISPATFEVNRTFGITTTKAWLADLRRT
jgi:cyclopropane fatty-acyl-phospholipid synthase-like methyltransferase